MLCPERSGWAKMEPCACGRARSRTRASLWTRLESYQKFDTALDSGGFVAMKRYGGYRWTIEQLLLLPHGDCGVWPL